MTLAELIAQQVREALDAALKDSEGLLTDVAKAGGDAAAGGMLGDIERLTDIISHIIGGIPGIGLLLNIIEGPLKAIEDSGGKLGRGFGIGYYLGYVGFQLTEPITRTLTQDVERIFHSQLIDPQTAAALAAKQVWSHHHASDEIEGSGIDGDKAAALIENAYEYPALAEMLDLLRRGEIDDNDVIFALKRHGTPDVWIERLLGLRTNLLSVADLALATLRGNITREQGVAYAHKLGFHDTDFDLLTENTGEPPGLMELLEAYRRTFIDKSRLERGIRQSRVRNEWIDVVEKLRYSPMSTADAARAVVQNYLHDAEGKTISEQNGLEPDHWRFIVESYGRPLAHGEMLSLYYRGLASRAQVDQAFRESDQKDKYSEQSFELGRRLLPDRMIVDAIKFGALTTKQGARKLMEKGYNKEDTDILLRLGLAEHKNTAKQFSKAEIVQLYEERLMSQGDAVTHLTKLGYSRHDADMELHLADTKAHASALRQETAHVRNSFLDGRLSDTEAENQLTALGIDRAQARHLITLWHRERGHATRLLTAAQVVKSASDKLIRPDNALDRLIALGYSHADAVILLRGKGVNVN